MSNKIMSCRYCHLEVEEGAKQCPHCGTHNPTIGVKKALLWTVGVISLFYVTGFVLQYFN
jgi:uncharacterized protein (UPF0212 family)